jgi:hypothetical protein
VGGPNHPVHEVSFSDSVGRISQDMLVVPALSATLLDVIHLLQAYEFSRKRQVREIRAFHNGHYLRSHNQLAKIFQEKTKRSLSFEYGGEWPSETITAIIHLGPGKDQRIEFPSVCSLGFVRAFLSISRGIPYDSVTFDPSTLNHRLKESQPISVHENIKDRRYTISVPPKTRLLQFRYLGTVRQLELAEDATVENAKKRVQLEFEISERFELRLDGFSWDDSEAVDGIGDDEIVEVCLIN